MGDTQTRITLQPLKFDHITLREVSGGWMFDIDPDTPVRMTERGMITRGDSDVNDFLEPWGTVVSAALIRSSSLIRYVDMHKYRLHVSGRASHMALRHIGETMDAAIESILHPEIRKIVQRTKSYTLPAREAQTSPKGEDEDIVAVFGNFAKLVKAMRAGDHDRIRHIMSYRPHEYLVRVAA